MITVPDNANLTDLQLKAMPFDKPAGVSNRWQGIPHYDLVHTLEERMDAAGWKFKNRRCFVDKTGFDMAGSWGVSVPGIDPMKDQELSIGFLHSNRCKRSLRLLVGSVVFVCTNGMATGEIVLAKKHALGLDLGSEIDSGLERYIVAAKELKKRTDLLKETELSDEQADHILMEAGRRGLIGFPTLGNVSKEYFHPTYADNGSKTAWGLYNAFTHVLKKTCVNTQLDLMYKFQNMMPVVERIGA